MVNIIKKHKTTNIVFVLSLCAFLISVLIAIKIHVGTSNLYVYQAEAFLGGHLDIPEKLPDVATYKDRYYVPFPPFPAMLVLPIKEVFGVVNTTLISLILTLVSVLAVKDILKKLNTDETASPWLLLAFFLGTGYWLAVIGSNGVWFFAHIVCVTFLLLSIREALGDGRGFLAGLFLGFAFLSRQLSIYSSMFIIAALLANHSNTTKKSKVWAMLSFVFALSTCILVYLAFNYFRFGSPFDTGYSYLDLEGFLALRVKRFGLFSPAYVPFNLIYMFFQGPHLEFGGSVTPQAMDPFGTSITFASPFLFSAFFAKGNKLMRISAWLAIGLTITHMVFYYNNGWAQANTQRFTLDFLPVLLVLVALSIESIKKHMSLFYWAIVYSVTLNIITLLLFPLIIKLLSTLREVF